MELKHGHRHTLINGDTYFIYRIRRSSPTRQRSPSPVEVRMQTWADNRQRNDLDILKKLIPQTTRYDAFDIENRPPAWRPQLRIQRK